MTVTLPRTANGHLRIRLGLIITLLGFLVFLLGADPGIFNLDRSPVIGFVQIAVFLIGLAIICVGGYICMNGLWSNMPKSIAADIGQRLVATGYMVAVASGMADLLGFGSHLDPNQAYFGPWQMRGVLLGEIMIAVGFLMMIPFQRQR
jgi:hypothetical protein